MPELSVPDALRALAPEARLEHDPTTGRIHVSSIPTVLHNGFGTFLEDELAEWRVQEAVRAAVRAPLASPPERLHGPRARLT